jgi:hypothetical protein
MRKMKIFLDISV